MPQSDSGISDIGKPIPEPTLGNSEFGNSCIDFAHSGHSGFLKSESGMSEIPDYFRLSGAVVQHCPSHLTVHLSFARDLKTREESKQPHITLEKEAAAMLTRVQRASKVRCPPRCHAAQAHQAPRGHVRTIFRTVPITQCATPRQLKEYSILLAQDW